MRYALGSQAMGMYKKGVLEESKVVFKLCSKLFFGKLINVMGL